MASPLGSFRLPSSTQRTAVLGHTGSGKTHFSAWLLSHMSYHSMPWYVIDIKRDDTILDSIEDAEEFDITQKKLPRKPGIHITHPMPFQFEEIEEFFQKVWHHGRTGIFVDESYLIKHGKWLESLLVTGRSRRIPMIMVSQRPVRVPRPVFSEADFLAVFPLEDDRDQKTVQEFFPGYLEQELPRFHVQWRDRTKRENFVLTPVEDREKILDRFASRLRERKEWNGFI